MRYSTTRACDCSKVVLWSFIACIGCYLVWGAIPFGLDPAPKISWSGEFSERERAGLSAALLKDNFFYPEGEFGRIYKDSFFSPWTRLHYRSYAKFVRGDDQISGVLMKSSAYGRQTGKVRASLTEEGWKLEHDWDNGNALMKY